MSAYTESRAALDAWRAELRSNRVDADPHLLSLLAHYDRDEGTLEDLRAFGEVVAGELDDLARQTNRDEHLPTLRQWDDSGHKTGEIEFHPGYHTIGSLAYGTGAMSLYAERGRELDSLWFEYLLTQAGEAGHACPFACTAGMIKILQDDGTAPPEWLAHLLDADYDTHYHAAQFLTEVQGGSDVGRNEAEAIPVGDGAWRITGEKWFCSVADAQLFLVTARPEGGQLGTRGLKAFAVPRHLSDGEVNGFTVRRIKDKLGTRSMASAEIDFEGAWAWPVGDFRRVLELVLDTSRTYNAVATAGILQRASLEAHAFARHRVAFGQPILRFPAVARIVARLRTEAAAARASAFYVADLGDRLRRGESTAYGAWRMLVNLDKYWTADAATAGVREAIEVLGGNGAIEEFSVLPRLLRDAIVMEQWEGTHNVLCAQVLRDSARHGLHRELFDHLAGLADGPDAGLDGVRARWERVLALTGEGPATHIRDVIDELRPVAQAILLRAERTGGGTWELLGVVEEHLLATTARGYDPLEDAGLMERVRALTD